MSESKPFIGLPAADGGALIGIRPETVILFDGQQQGGAVLPNRAAVMCECGNGVVQQPVARGVDELLEIFNQHSPGRFVRFIGKSGRPVGVARDLIITWGFKNEKGIALVGQCALLTVRTGGGFVQFEVRHAGEQILACLNGDTDRPFEHGSAAADIISNGRLTLAKH